MKQFLEVFRYVSEVVGLGPCYCFSNLSREVLLVSPTPTG